MDTVNTGRIDGRQRLRPLVAAFWILALLAGCSEGPAPGNVHFSPDGSVAAFTYVRRINLPIPPEVPVIHSTVYLKWCTGRGWRTCREIKIDAYGRSYGPFVQARFRLMFSPDARRLAVRTPRFLEVVDLESGARRRLTGPDETVTSLGWRGNSEIVYVVHQKNPHASGSTRRIYRHPVDAPPDGRQALHVQEGYRGTYQDYVSPTGGHVIFMSEGHGNGDFQLLDVETGEVIPLGGEAGWCGGVAWKRDGTCAFCLGSRKTFLCYPGRGQPEIKDVSAAYDATFRRRLKYAPSIDPLWTPDDAYVVIQVPWIGGCLIRPDPWTVIPLGKRLVEHLEGVAHRRVYRERPDDYPFVTVQPFPGWVKVCAQFIEGQKTTPLGQPVALAMQGFLVDYPGRRFVAVKSAVRAACNWTLTPDGRNLVTFKPGAVLAETPVRLPEGN